MSHVMNTSSHKGTSLLVLIAIANRADERGTDVWPSIAWLSRMARTSERHVQRILKELEDSGELSIERGEGPKGTHRYTIRGVGSQVMPWADVRGGRRVTPDGSSPPTPVSPNTSSTRTEVDQEGTDVLGDAHVTPDKMSPLSEEAGAPPRLTPAAEIKAIQAEAEKLWKAERRRKFGSAGRFLDSKSLEGLRIATRRALQQGCDWVDIATAIHLHADDPVTKSPWYLDEWARVAKAKREDDDQAYRARMAQRRTDRESAERAESEWAELRARYPGRTKAEIVELEAAATQRRGGLKPVAALITPLHIVSDAEAAS